jgi:putative transposase
VGRRCQGAGFVSLALLRWAKDERLESVLSDPGKPWQNGTNESLNGKSGMNAWRWNGSATG